MTGSSKAKKEKVGSGKGKNSIKSKAKKEKLEDATEIEELKSLIVEDEFWQPIIVIVAVEGQNLQDNVLEQLNDLPENFTVVTPKNIFDINEKVPPGRSRESSKTRKGSASKDSKKAAKAKETGSKRSNKQEKQEAVKSTEVNSLQTCISLKKNILELKNKDFQEHGITEWKNQQDTTKNNMRSQHEHVLESKSNIIILRFIILVGFYDFNLLQECFNFNIIVKAIIDIKEISPMNKSTELVPVLEKKQKGKTKKLSKPDNPEKYQIFETKLNESMKDKQFLEINKHLLFLKYSIKTDKSKGAYKTFAPNFLKILSGISEAWGKFSTYGKALTVQEVPDMQEIVTLEDANLYTTLVSMVPPECSTVPFVMHCILEQVYWWDEHILSRIDETSQLSDNIATVATSGSNLSTQTKSIRQSFVASCRLRTINSSSLDSDMYIPDITPVLIDTTDQIRCTTFHLQIPEIDFQKITLNMLSTSPVYKLWLNYPPASAPKLKWFEFHLQRFKKCTENCYNDCDKLFSYYLHQSIMNVLIAKPEKLSIHKYYCSSDDEDNDTYLLPMNLYTPENESIKSYIQGIICNILCRVSKNCNENPSSLGEPSSKEEEHSSKILRDLSSKEVYVTNSKLSVMSKWYEIKKLVPKYGPHLDEKTYYRILKVNKLKSFLLCPEFINLYEDVKNYIPSGNDHMKMYEFVENLNASSMSQSLQEAFANFVNCNYYYFSPNDTILLWFNNSETQDRIMSRKIKGILETPLGFRDFYKYKLGGKSHFEEMPEEEIMAEVSDLIEADNFSDSFSTYQFSQSSHDSHSKRDKFLPTVVTNFGSQRIEHSECYDYFFSPDGTKVTVKKTKYFSDHLNIAVTVTKNNTSIHYNVKPQVSNTLIEVMMKMHNDITILAHLTWLQPDPTKVVTEYNELGTTDSNTNNSLILNCDFNATLPSGLLIEIVPTTELGLGPFYIRQRYLFKGPTCDKIWEETARCFLKNGTIIIFNADNTVYILYNNGTMVRCSDFEWEKVVSETVPVKDEVNPEENYVEVKIQNSDEMFAGKDKKEGKRKGKDKEKKDDQTQSVPTSQKKKSKKDSTPLKQKYLNLEEDKTEEEIYMNKATRHSVLSWDGYCKEFNRNFSKNSSKIQDLRVAFDKVNQELYLHRSDGETSLFTPQEFTILLPDGSKITSYVDDSMELDIESGTLLETVENSIEGSGSCSQEWGTDGNSKVSDLSSSSTAGSFEETSTCSSSKSQTEKGQMVDESCIYVQMSYLFEHQNYASVKYNSDNSVKITLPGDIAVYFDSGRMFTIDAGGHEKITLTHTKLTFEAQTVDGCSQQSITTLHFKNLTTNPTVTCQTVDSLCNVFTVSENGHTTLVKNEIENSSSIIPLHPKNIERYFVFNRDLTGYEMIRNYKIDDKNNGESIKSPIVQNINSLFTLYTQTPIFKNKSEEYLMSFIKNKNLPSLIKRKDLLKLEEMPETIWFYPHISKVTENKYSQNNERNRAIPAAVKIFKCSKIKNDIDLSIWFSSALCKYMEIGESLVNRYLHHYPEENRDERIYAEGKFHKETILGSQSYFLTDNLPKVVLDDILNNKDSVSIHSVSNSTVSKITSMYGMVNRIKEAYSFN